MSLRQSLLLIPLLVRITRIFNMTFYTNHFIPPQSAGCVHIFLIPFIFIRPNYKDDAGLLAHEKLHVIQAWRNIIPSIHALRYLFSPSYRLACEVECYKKQATYYTDDRLPLFATFISKDYNLNITVQEALTLLQKEA